MPNLELVNPFCQNPKAVQYPDLNERFVYKIAPGEVDKETMQYVPKLEKVDLQEEIEAAEKLCGMAYMKDLLKQGRISPEDLQDNAGENYDLTHLPGNVHEAKKLSEEANAEVQKFAKAAGLKEGEKYSQTQFEAAVEAAVQKIYEKQAAQVAAQQQKEGDK